MKTFTDFKKRLLKNKRLLKAYDDLEPEFAIASTVISKRLEQGLTQSDLAKKIGTKQSAISRLESGSYNPTISFLEKTAKALKLNLVVRMN